MSDLLARIKAKKEAAKKVEHETNPPAVKEEKKAQSVPTKSDEELKPSEIPTMSEEEYQAKQKEQAKPDAEVMMGITVEDLQERIAHVFEHAKIAEKHEIKEDMDGLKQAIHSNPSIVQHLLPQDIGKMVGTLRKIHSEARIEAAQSPAKKKAAKSAETKAAKELLKKPLSKEDLDGLMDEL